MAVELRDFISECYIRQNDLAEQRADAEDYYARLKLRPGLDMETILKHEASNYAVLDREEADLANKIFRAQQELNFLENCAGKAYALPREILSTIFMEARYALEDEEANLMMPLWIAQVCRLWRSIALESPELWTRVRLWHTGCPLQVQQTIVSRSGDALLEVMVSLVLHEDLASHWTFWWRLIPRCARLRMVIGEDARPPFKDKRADAHHLRTLEVVHPLGPALRPRPRQFCQDLSIVKSCHLTLDALTHLLIEGLFVWRDVEDVARAAPLLTHLHIMCHAQPRSGQPFEFPELHVLELGMGNLEDITALLENMSAPRCERFALSTLQLVDRHTEGEWKTSSMSRTVEVFRRALPSVTSLSLDDHRAIPVLSHALPNVESLELRSFFQNAALQHLIIRGDVDGAVWPQLSRLSLNPNHETARKVDRMLVLSCVQSRSRAGIPIEGLVIRKDSVEMDVWEKDGQVKRIGERLIPVNC